MPSTKFCYNFAHRVGLIRAPRPHTSSAHHVRAPHPRTTSTSSVRTTTTSRIFEVVAVHTTTPSRHLEFVIAATTSINDDLEGRRVVNRIPLHSIDTEESYPYKAEVCFNFTHLQNWYDTIILKMNFASDNVLGLFLKCNSNIIFIYIL